MFQKSGVMLIGLICTALLVCLPGDAQPRTAGTDSAAALGFDETTDIPALRRLGGLSEAALVERLTSRLWESAEGNTGQSTLSVRLPLEAQLRARGLHLSPQPLASPRLRRRFLLVRRKALFHPKL